MNFIRCAWVTHLSFFFSPDAHLDFMGTDIILHNYSVSSQNSLVMRMVTHIFYERFWWFNFFVICDVGFLNNNKKRQRVLKVAHELATMTLWILTILMCLGWLTKWEWCFFIIKLVRKDHTSNSVWPWWSVLCRVYL